MGPTVFSASTNATAVSAFAHCAPGGGLSLGYVNFSPDAPAALDVRGPGALGTTPRLLRVLTSEDNVAIALNGAPLKYVPGSEALPPLDPKADESGGLVVVPPHSVGFITWPSAAYYNCQH